MKKFFEKKEFNGAVSFVDMPISYKSMRGRALIEEGYKSNVIVYRSVQRIIGAIKSINVKLKNAKGEFVEDHDVLKLLKRPNPTTGRGGFLDKIFIQRLVLGEMFISVVRAGEKSEPKELWDYSPIEMKVVPGAHIPKAYIHEVEGSKVTFKVDAVTGESEMFFWKGEDPNPNQANFYRGMSPLFAASLAADTNNSGLKWNNSLLKNGSRSSGILSFAKKPSEDAYLRAKEWFKSAFQGENNAGEVPILWGDTKYEELGKSPKDMDFTNTLNMTTAFIATAYGVPLPLVLNDASTFNNMEQAKEILYTDTVIPMYEDFLECFGNWLLPKFGLEDHEFVIDKNSISALEGLRTRRRDSFTKMVTGGVISPDEAREETGFEARGGAADELYMPASSLPIEDESRGEGDDATE